LRDEEEQSCQGLRLSEGMMSSLTTEATATTAEEDPEAEMEDEENN
jgi:hypothetical protein